MTRKILAAIVICICASFTFAAVVDEVPSDGGSGGGSGGGGVIIPIQSVNFNSTLQLPGIWGSVWGRNEESRTSAGFDVSLAGVTIERFGEDFWTNTWDTSEWTAAWYISGDVDLGQTYPEAESRISVSRRGVELYQTVRAGTKLDSVWGNGYMSLFPSTIKSANISYNEYEEFWYDEFGNITSNGWKYHVEVNAYGSFVAATPEIADKMGLAFVPEPATLAFFLLTLPFVRRRSH